MPLNILLPELLKLTREEKVEAIKILQQEVGHSEQTQSAGYEVWSPQISPEGARQLLNMLKEDKEKRG